MWAGFSLGPIVATIYALYLLAGRLYDPEHLTALTPSWVLLVFGVQSLVYLGAVLVALPVSYLKLENGDRPPALPGAGVRRAGGDGVLSAAGDRCSADQSEPVVL